MFIDGDQEQYSKEFEDKKTELQPKVIEIYEASSTEIKVHTTRPNYNSCDEKLFGINYVFCNEINRPW